MSRGSFFEASRREAAANPGSLMEEMSFFIPPCSAIRAPAFWVPLARTHLREKVSLASLGSDATRNKLKRKKEVSAPPGGSSSETS